MREITFKSAIFDKRVRISSWMPSAKYAFAFSSLRFSNGKTAIDFSGITGACDSGLACGSNDLTYKLARTRSDNAAIRLAYIHNIGDVYVSLAPVAAGFLVVFTGRSVFDPIIAGAIAIWILLSTACKVLGSHAELIWPDKIVCGHPDHNQPGLAAG